MNEQGTNLNVPIRSSGNNKCSPTISMNPNSQLVATTCYLNYEDINYVYGHFLTMTIKQDTYIKKLRFIQCFRTMSNLTFLKVILQLLGNYISIFLPASVNSIEGDRITFDLFFQLISIFCFLPLQYLPKLLYSLLYDSEQTISYVYLENLFKIDRETYKKFDPTSSGALNAQEFFQFLREDHNVISLIIDIRERMLKLWIQDKLYQIIQNRRLDYPKLWYYKTLHNQYPSLTFFQKIQSYFCVYSHPSRIDFEGCSTHTMELYFDNITQTKRKIRTYHKKRRPRNHSRKNKKTTMFSVKEAGDVREKINAKVSMYGNNPFLKMMLTEDQKTSFEQ